MRMSLHTCGLGPHLTVGANNVIYGEQCFCRLEASGLLYVPLTGTRSVQARVTDPRTVRLSEPPQLRTSLAGNISHVLSHVVAGQSEHRRGDSTG